MRWLSILAALALLSACGSDVERLIEEKTADAGDVTARLDEILWGGAAGGITFCVDLIASGKKKDCVVSATHLQGGGIKWEGRDLIFSYCGGTLFNNGSGVRHEGLSPFMIVLKQDCSTELLWENRPFIDAPAH